MGMPRRITLGITLVELLLATLLAGLLVTGAVRLVVTSSDQQRAVLQTTGLQAELRRAAGVVQQVVAEQPFLLPMRGSPAGLEFLHTVNDSRFRVLGVSATGLTVRFLNPSYDPRSLQRVVVVDSGGNGYVYRLTGVSVLDAATGTYALEGTACAVPSGQGLRGAGGMLARLGNGAALNSFVGSGELSSSELYFQRESQNPERLAALGSARLRYIYRASDGQTLYQDTASLYQQTGGERFDLVGVSLDFQASSGSGNREAQRNLDTDVLFQHHGGLGVRRLDCSPLGAPATVVGDWRVEIAGLDPGVSGLVGINGPGGFNRTLTSSATMTGLRQGVYSVTADSVVNPGLPYVRYRPTLPAEGSSLGVEVGPVNRPQTRVQYVRVPGRLRAQVEGLPDGIRVSLGAAGSFESYTFNFDNGEHRVSLEAGRYTLQWPSIPDPQGRGEWIPSVNSQTVAVPSDGEADAGTIRYVLAVGNYRLELNVRLLGGESPLRSPLVCVQPEVEVGAIPGDAVLDRCLFR